MSSRRSGRQAAAVAAAAPAKKAASSSGSELSPARSLEEVADEEPPQSASQTRNTGNMGLQFADALTWRAGRTIPVAELLKRLQALSTEMRGMEQLEDAEAKATFTKVAKELASEHLLSHKDKGVRAWAASCAVDVLRLCAPDAPFTERELRAVFDNIVKSILPALSNPSNSYNAQHMYVLQSLAQIKSIVLVTDLPNADSLLQFMFQNFFDTLSGSSKSSTGEQLGKQVVFNMTTALVALVDELEQLPQDVVDTIMAQFLRVDSRVIGPGGSKSKKGAVAEGGQATLEMKELPPAYVMAKTICNSCSDKMAREVSKYFSDVIMEVTARTRERRKEAGDVDNLEDVSAGPSEEDVQELSKAHRLMRELWRACPGVLHNVIPQLEAELGAENLRLRLLATESLGDIIAGIGSAGPPPPPNTDPAAYPPTTLLAESDSPAPVNLLTVPAAPQSFSQTFSEAYQAFLGRGNDKSPLIRAARITGVGRILTTSAGGVGLSNSEEKHLVEELARALNDSDEKVRLAAVRAVAGFSFKDVVNKLGLAGSVDHPGSVLANLSERVKDKKPIVREEAMTTLAKIWALATGEMLEGNEQVVSLINGASSKILNAYYTNDPELMAMIDKMLLEVLVPLRYPPIKNKATKNTKATPQRIKDSQATIEVDGETKTVEPDQIRAERILLLANGLDERAKKVFLSFSSRQVTMRKYLLAYLQTCETYNGGVIDKDEAEVKNRLSRLIDIIAKMLPDPSKAGQDLQKFAKLHDRRNYQLLRFCMAPESDYRTAYNAIKEFRKRIEGSNQSAALIETFQSLIYRSAILLYNKSHVPSYLNYSRTNEKELASIAHEILMEISQRSPEVLKADISEICQNLQEDAPTSTKPNGAGAVDGLKACAAFARKFTEEIPQDAKFVKAMSAFALFGVPPEAAKHAVTIIMTSSKRKEMLAKDLVSHCVKDFGYGKAGFLSRLATLSRLALLAPAEVDEHIEAVLNIATKDILLNVRQPSKAGPEEYEWMPNADDEVTAKCWALRVLVNRVRSHRDAATLGETSSVVFNLLNKLIENNGELSKARTTPPGHKTRLRLQAARCLLKMCTSHALNNLVDAQSFQNLALVAMDPIYNVRLGFMQRLKKYLGQNRLPPRFYVIPFLLAYEPEAAFRNETVTWLRSRVTFFASQKANSSTAPAGATEADKDKAASSKIPTTMESVLPRLLHLLAHHPDYDDSTQGLSEFARYLVFYISAAATPQNISLIYHLAQRVKTCSDATRDAVAVDDSGTPSKRGTPKKSRKSMDTTDYDARLHLLSDLATLTVRAFVDAYGWMLSSLPVRVTLPRSLFAEIRDRDRAVILASQNLLPDPDTLQEEIEKLARAAARKAGAGSYSSKRRRSDHASSGPATGEEGERKKGRSSTGGTGVKKERKSSGRKRTRDWEGSEDESDEGSGGDAKRGRVADTDDAANRRTSGRTAGARSSYRERRDEEDDEEMEDANVSRDDSQDEDASSDVGDEDMPDAGDAKSQRANGAGTATKKADAHAMLMAGARAKKDAPPAKSKKLAERKAPASGTRSTRSRG